jgi:hypothetical protein
VHDEIGRQAADHYLKCLKDARMKPDQLADNVKAFASTQPKLQKSVQGALVNYLIELCGLPPQSN